VIDLVELAEQGDAGVVDDDVEAGMSRCGGLRELFNLTWFRDVDAVNADLLQAGFGDLGGKRLQSGLVAIRQRQVAAARRSSSASARPIPLAAPVTAAAAPRIAVI
jgi:hypothetical protein